MEPSSLKCNSMTEVGWRDAPDSMCHKNNIAEQCEKKGGNLPAVRWSSD